MKMTTNLMPWISTQMPATQKAQPALRKPACRYLQVRYCAVRAQRRQGSYALSHSPMQAPLAKSRAHGEEQPNGDQKQCGVRRVGEAPVKDSFQYAMMPRPMSDKSLFCIILRG